VTPQTPPFAATPNFKDRIIISKDEDFFYFAKQRHTKIKVIWVRLGNCRTSALRDAFERSWQRIESCLNAGDRVIEIR
jgi:predicted nuclease of predicted toxin-antitoxin system